METIARNRGTSIDASAGFSRVQSLRPPRYPISETVPAIAPGAVENPRFLVIVSTVKELLGHESFEMTLRYAHLSPDVKREAVQRLDIGGVGGAEGEREMGFERSTR